MLDAKSYSRPAMSAAYANSFSESCSKWTYRPINWEFSGAWRDSGLHKKGRRQKRMKLHCLKHSSYGEPVQGQHKSILHTNLIQPAQLHVRTYAWPSTKQVASRMYLASSKWKAAFGTLNSLSTLWNTVTPGASCKGRTHLSQPALDHTIGTHGLPSSLRHLAQGWPVNRIPCTVTHFDNNWYLGSILGGLDQVKIGRDKLILWWQVERVHWTQFTPSVNQLGVNLPDAVVNFVPWLHFVCLASKGLAHYHVPTCV